MLNNYQYFIVLAEELNISKAAERLFISHQCLSKYLKNLEQEYKVTFFERTPKLALTSAGQVYLDMLKQVQFLESNMENQLEDIRQSRKGLIRFGTTEGRYRVLLPSLLAQFKRIYPEVTLRAYSATTGELLDRVARNELDMALLNRRDAGSYQFDRRTVLNERLYLVISDHVLAQYFPEEYPTCKDRLKEGADLEEFSRREVPFVLNYKGFNSRETLEKHMQTRSFSLNCVMELTQQDMQFMLAAQDFAACFCWSMYLPSVQQINESSSQQLNVFPIKGLTETNQLMLILPRGKILPAYGKELMRLIQQDCTSFANI